MIYKDQIVQAMNEAFSSYKVSTTIKTFDQYTTITRSTNTTAYAAGQLISGVSAVNSSGTIAGYTGTTLIPINLTPDGATANQRIQITQVSILSNQNPSTSTLVPIIQLFNNALSSLTDAQTFTPTFDTLNSYRQVCLQTELNNTANYSTNAYYVMSADFARLANLDSNGKIYAALIANNTYTPKSGELIKIRIRGFLI